MTSQKNPVQDRKVTVLDLSGKATSRTITLPGVLFDVPLNVPLIHQVVEAQRAAARAGTHKTKTRGEVSGGGRKPFRQKGTGNARQGSIRAPHYKGGGVVHGPQPRDYSQRTPKKMIAGALRSALSDRARNEAVIVLEDLVAEDTPSTKAAIEILSAVTKGGRVLVVVDRDEDGATAVVKSYSNVPEVHILWSDQLNTYDVVNADEVLFSEDAINAYVERALLVAPARETIEAPEEATRKAPAKKADTKKSSAKKAAKKVEEVAEEIESAAKKVVGKVEEAAEKAEDDVKAAAKKSAAKKADKKATAKKSAEEDDK